MLVSFIMYSYFLRIELGLFKKKKEKNQTKCKECGLELPSPERLERHLKKAHGNVPEKKLDDRAGGSDGGMW